MIDLNIRYRLGRVWMSIIKFNIDVLIILYDNLFNFFMDNLKEEHNELNFNTCDFFNFILQENESLIKSDKIKNSFYKNLPM